MAIELIVTCSMCYPPKKPQLEITLESAKDLSLEAISKLIEKEGWIVQHNGEYLDAYCTKRCAA